MEIPIVTVVLSSEYLPTMYSRRQRNSNTEPMATLETIPSTFSHRKEDVGPWQDFLKQHKVWYGNMR
jgi:hypothetical protein